MSSGRVGVGHAAALVGVKAVVADGLLPLWRDVLDGGGDEVGGLKDLEVALGAPVFAGAVDDGLGALVPVDLLEREGHAQQVLGQVLAAGDVVRRDGFRAVIDVEAAVFPGEQVVELGGADELGLAQGVEEAVAEEFGDRSGAFRGHAVEAPGLVEESVGGQYVQVRVEYQVVAEAVDCRNCRDAPVGQVEAGAEGVAQGFGGGVEEDGEQLAAFAEDAAEHARHGEHELAVGNLAADVVGDPVAGGQGAALVAGGAEIATFAGEGHELFVAAVGALEAGEAGGQVTAAEEGLDDRHGGRGERAVGLAVAGFVVGEEVGPAVVDGLPERGGAGTAGLVDGRHKGCS